jgi:hypothetical protein
VDPAFPLERWSVDMPTNVAHLAAALCMRSLHFGNRPLPAAARDTLRVIINFLEHAQLFGRGGFVDRRLLAVYREEAGIGGRRGGTWSIKEVRLVVARVLHDLGRAG